MTDEPANSPCQRCIEGQEVQCCGGDNEIWLQFRFKVGGRGQGNKLAMMRRWYRTNMERGWWRWERAGLWGSEHICAHRSMVNQCRSAITHPLTEHHSKPATEATKKCAKGWSVSLCTELADCLAWLPECLDAFSPGRFAICFCYVHLEMVKGCMFGGFTGALPLQNKPARLSVTPALVFLLWSLCPCPQRYKSLVYL